MIRFDATPTEWQPPYRLAPADKAEGDARELLASVAGEPAVGQFLEWGARQHALAQLTRFLRFGVKFQTIKKRNRRGFVRLSGIRAANEYFGTTPPDPPKKRYACRDGRLYEREPQYRAIVDEITVAAWRHFQKHFPAQAAAHEAVVKASIHPDWLIAGTPFTSGIVNDRSALPYHKDGGNLVGTWSMMVALRQHTGGGALNIPELGITLAIPDGSLTIFEGQRYWHGVTPMVYRKKDAYRFTLVWYVKQAIRQCGCRAEETARASAQATKIQDGYGS
jgi:hypothetical protein